jgi:Tol biopolymer transport system component
MGPSTGRSRYGVSRILLISGTLIYSDGYDWWPFESGIYFYAYQNGKAEIDFLDLGTSRIRRISTLDKPPAPWLGGLSVSPDRRWLLYSRIDETASDLMLVENFH